MSFKLKTIALFLMVSLVPYIFTMLIFGNSFRDELSKNIRNEMNTQLQITIERIEQHLQTLKKDIAFMAASEVMNDVFTEDLDRRISRMLQDKKKDLQLQGDFWLLNSDGRVIAASDFEKIGEKITEPALFASEVISPFNGETIASLRVTYRLENLQRFFSNTANRHYIVIDADQKILFRPTLFKDALSVAMPLKSLKGISVGLEENKSYAYRLLDKYENWFIVTLFIGAAFIIAAAFYFAMTLIRPLLKLSQTANTITRTQDYTTKVEVDRNDEIGQMGHSFNQMTEGMDKALREIILLNEEIEETQREVVFTMGAIGKSRSKETGNHVKRVAEYSKLLALYLGLDEEESELLKQASPMHDIGKVAIPDAILNKPGKLTPDEFSQMQKHAELGYAMLKSSNRPLLQAAAIVAREHHEKYDGSGYPRGLIGEEIHLYGRITAVADVFDALGSDRVYKKAWEDEKIFALFKEERGKHFDPGLVDIFFEHLDEFLSIRERFKDI